MWSSFLKLILNLARYPKESGFSLKKWIKIKLNVGFPHISKVETQNAKGIEL